MAYGWSLSICTYVSKTPLGMGAELGAGREDRDRTEARGESQSSELKPGLPGYFEDICHGRRLEHIFI